MLDLYPGMVIILLIFSCNDSSALTPGFAFRRSCCRFCLARPMAVLLFFFRFALPFSLECARFWRAFAAGVVLYSTCASLNSGVVLRVRSRSDLQSLHSDWNPPFPDLCRFIEKRYSGFEVWHFEHHRIGSAHSTSLLSESICLCILVSRPPSTKV